MRRPLMVTVVAALVLAMPALADRRYRDATGENPAAADIASVTVSNDATTGEIEFAVQLVNSAQLEDEVALGQVSVDLLVDADRNPATGDPRGFDAEVSTEGGVLHWDGKRMSPIDGILVGGFSADSVDVSLPQKDILLTRPKQTFDFVVVSHRLTSNQDAVDVAPNAGVYTYTLAGAPASGSRRQHGRGGHGHCSGRRPLPSRAILGRPLERHNGADR